MSTGRGSRDARDSSQLRSGPTSTIEQVHQNGCPGRLGNDGRQLRQVRLVTHFDPKRNDTTLYCAASRRRKFSMLRTLKAIGLIMISIFTVANADVPPD